MIMTDEQTEHDAAAKMEPRAPRSAQADDGRSAASDRRSRSVSFGGQLLPRTVYLGGDRYLGDAQLSRAPSTFDGRSRGGTLVNVLVPDQDGKKSKRPSGSELAKWLSYFYSMLLMILGLLLPLAEALHNEWLETPYGAAFLTYLTTIGTIFLLYLQHGLLRGVSVQRVCCCKPCATFIPCSRSSSQTSSTPSSQTFTTPFSQHFYTASPTCQCSNTPSSQTCSSNSLTVPATGSSNTHTSSDIQEKFTTKNDKISNLTIHNIQCHTDTDNHSNPALPVNQTAQGPSRWVGCVAPAHGGAAVVGTHEDDSDSVGSASDLNSDKETVEWVDLTNFGSVFSHDGSSLYLRLGVLVFGLGNIVYCALEMQNVLRSRDSCEDQYSYGWTYIPRLVFIVVQTFYLFKGTEAEVTRHETLAWIGFMHLVSTNVCLWFRTLVNEVMNDYIELGHAPNSTAALSLVSSDVTAALSLVSDVTAALSLSINDTTNTMLLEGVDSVTTRVSAGGHSGAVNLTTVALMLSNVRQRRDWVEDSSLTMVEAADCESLLKFLSSYLFPFVLEYSLICIGYYMCIMNAGVGPIKVKDDIGRGFRNLIKVYALSMPTSEDAQPDPDDPNTPSSHHDPRHTTALHKSHVGVFLGILLTGLSVISIVIYHVYPGEELAQILFVTSDLVLHASLLLGCATAALLSRHLAYVAKPLTTDDMLLLLAMVGAVTFELSAMIPAVVKLGGGGDWGYQDPLQVATSLLSAAQSMLQTLLVLAALRRYPSRAQDVTRMPGRGAFAFLVIGNLAVWLLRTIVARSVEMSTALSFYSVTPWMLLINVSYPLLLFHRFHSSVCLADVWHVAYTPLHKKVRKACKPQQSAATALDLDPHSTAPSASPATLRPASTGGSTHSSRKSRQPSIGSDRRSKHPRQSSGEREWGKTTSQQTAEPRGSGSLDRAASWLADSGVELGAGQQRVKGVLRRVSGGAGSGAGGVGVLSAGVGRGGRMQQWEQREEEQGGVEQRGKVQEGTKQGGKEHGAEEQGGNEQGNKEHGGTEHDGNDEWSEEQEGIEQGGTDQGGKEQEGKKQRIGASLSISRLGSVSSIPSISVDTSHV